MSAFWGECIYSIISLCSSTYVEKVMKTLACVPHTALEVAKRSLNISLEERGK